MNYVYYVIRTLRVRIHENAFSLNRIRRRGEKIHFIRIGRYVTYEFFKSLINEFLPHLGSHLRENDFI